MPTTTRRRRKRAHSLGVPSLHLVLIIVAFAIVALGFVGHLLKPNDQLSSNMVILGLGMIGGKLTNGFGKPVGHLLGMQDTDGDGLPDAEGAAPNGKNG